MMLTALPSFWPDVTVLTFFFSADGAPVWLRLVAALAVAMGFTLCHEIGHVLAARTMGCGTRELSLGRGPALLAYRDVLCGSRRERLLRAVCLRLVPLGGYVVYDDHYDLLGRPAKAFCSAGGWAADLVVFVGLLAWARWTGPTPGADGSPLLAVLLWFGWLKVAFGLTPLTGDGRAILRHLGGGLLTSRLSRRRSGRR